MNIALDQIKSIDKIRCEKRIGKISDTDAMKIADLLIEIFRY